MDKIGSIDNTADALTELGNLLVESGRLALAQDWPKACMTAMNANQIMSRLLRDAVVRDAAQTKSIAILKAEVTALKDAMSDINPYLDEDTEVVRNFRKALGEVADDSAVKTSQV
jgi:hypothetical protein